MFIFISQIFDLSIFWQKKTTNSLLERVKLNRFNKKTLLPWKQESLNFLEELAGEETFIRCVFQVG